MLERQIRAFTPWPGAWFMIGDERIKVLSARLSDGNAAPGTIIGPGLTVACGIGALHLTRIQRAGKAPMDDQSYLRGAKLAPVLPCPAIG